MPLTSRADFAITPPLTSAVGAETTACEGAKGKRHSGRIVGYTEVRAEQRVVLEGSSPSGAQMRGAISKSGVHSLAGRRTARGTPEGRVSTVRWDPKGMRRSTGP